jgi:hypothetical protein
MAPEVTRPTAPLCADTYQAGRVHTKAVPNNPNKVKIRECVRANISTVAIMHGLSIRWKEGRRLWHYQHSGGRSTEDSHALATPRHHSFHVSVSTVSANFNALAPL